MLAILRDAGWPIWPLVLASVIALALVFERFWTLRAKRVLPAQVPDEVLVMLDKNMACTEALADLEKHSPLGRVLAAGAGALARSEGFAAATSATEETGRRVAHDLERYLNALGTIAAIAPLLGLFGTVVGMIEIFAGQDSAGGSPVQLAHGISVALYNTAFGLIVAIPALIAWRGFRRHVDELVVELEWRAAKFLRAAQQMGLGA
ncbi:MAG: MotA/TolQ/ExbB proton channel family protein [Candidatus Protistobacter heckmanni]|nr:MotA/TolQ/ExbB proton channel family protein [Candidatus Protistobacter heckmanni]